MAIAATFDTFSVEEIIENLRAVNVNFTEEDILNPTPARAQIVYDAYLLYFFHIPRDAIARTVTDSLSSIEYSEVYAEAVGNMVYWRTVEQMMRMACVDNFGLRDVTNPEPNRFRNHCAALSNLQLYDEQQQEEVLNPASTKLELLQTEAEEANAHLAELEQMERDLRERNRMREIETRELEIKTTEMTKMLKAKKLELKDLNEVVEAKREERREVIQRSDTRRENSASLDKEITRLRSLLISSPERLIQSLAEMRSELRKEKQALDHAERTKEDREEVIKIMEIYSSEIKKSIEQLGMYQADLNALDDVRDRLKNRESDAANFSDRISELSTKLGQVQRRLATTTANLQRADKLLETNRDAGKRKMKSLAEEVDTLTQQNDESAKEEAKKVELIKALETDIEAILSRGHREMAAGREKYEALKEEFHQYSNKLNRALDQLRAYESTQ